FAAPLIYQYRPMLNISTVLTRERIAAIRHDDSRSMTIQDLGQQSRLAAVKHLLNPKQGTFLAHVDRRFQYRLFKFSRHLQKLDSLEDLRSEGTGTSLEASLESVLKEIGPAPLATVVVFCD